MKMTRVKQEHYPEWAFRPNTPMYSMKVQFVFMNGGMGDYICWMQAIRWLASEAKWIKGILMCPTYMIELANYWLKDFPEWKVVDYKEIKNISHADNTPVRGPMMLERESLNATGAHLLTCGWVYFCNKEKAPAGWDYYPQFKQDDLNKIELPDEAKALEPKKYAVITTGVTTNSRKVPGAYWNPIIQYVKDKGLTPVFLGKSVVETGNVKNIHAQFSEDIDMSLGLDLRNKTNLLQAASIISNAAFIVGHDNGLLHLAGCTETPIVFGYNLASPEHREPRRPKGKCYNVVLTEKELACVHCQSKFNFVLGYNFRQCFYGDNKCLDILFESEGKRWKEQIDLALLG